MTKSFRPRNTQIDVTVVVDDINDNDPVFFPVLHVSLPETAVSGTMIAVPIAQDVDASDNRKLTYEISPQSDIFDIWSMGGEPERETTDVFHVLKTTVDRETMSQMTKIAKLT